jgi:HK97 family phage portal protein
MRFLGFDITRAPGRRLYPTANGSGGWYPVVREPSTGAWQRNEELRSDSVLSYSAVFACVTLIASDIAKLGLRLVEQDDHGIWTPADVPAFSPVLRKPNRYQTRIKFVEQWLTSKLVHGNTYVLKQRDARGVVVALYVLDPTRVVPLVAPDGAVYYELSRDDLSTLTAPIVVPAREIIHDPMVCLFHPLIGVSPIFACGLAALQGLKIQDNSVKFFANASQPGGVLIAPTEIGDDQALRMKTYWEENFTGANAGRLLVVGNGMKYEPLSVNATDSQLVEQLKWSAETVCSCYHVPPYKLGVGPPPSFNNTEAWNQEYYAQCLQALIENFELTLDEGLELPRQYGTEFNLDDLLRMDTPTKSAAAREGVTAGCLSPNEARKRYFDLGPVDGGDSPYLQQQNYSLSALAARDDAASLTPAPAAPPTVQDDDDEPTDDLDDVEVARLFYATNQKAIAGGLYDA